jgi:hypothetical protein
MELLERYLQAVRFLLPKKQRHDVDRELSEDLRSQIEEREAEMGRPLEEDELAALLKGFGHPVVLALRYQQGRYLIGPEIFPLYWFAVKFVAGILAVVHILLPAIFFLLTNEPAGRIVGLFLRFPGVALPVLAWITIAFAILETPAVRSAIEQSLSSWRPQSLPAIVKEEPARRPSVTGFVLGVLLSVWWLAGLQFPRLLLGPGADYVGFGPIFYRLYGPMALAAALSIVLGWIRLSRPHWTRFSWMSGLVVDAMGLIILFLLQRGSGWLVAGERLSRVPGSEGLIEIVNLVAGVGLSIALVVSAVTFAWQYFIRVWPWHGRPAPPPTT